MRHSSILTLAFLACLLSLPLEAAANRFSQLTLGFNNPKAFRYYSIKSENAVVLEIQGVSPVEINGLDNYDEDHLRRVQVKDLGGQGSEVKLILKNRQIRATVSSFDEPFRIVVDLYNQDFREPRDQVTGMPLALGDRPTSVTSPSDLEDSQPEAHNRAPAAPAAPSEGKRMLMQPTPTQFHQPEDLVAAMNAAPAGVGTYWREYPFYIYRLQTAVFESTKGNPDFVKQNAARALTSAESMADYAGQLFNFGHEQRALLAYQQVLHKDPSVFDNNALHLWRFAESHLGQGNLTLADGYFQSLTEKHRGNPLVPFAQMRRLDIQAIRGIQQNGPGDLSALVNGINSISPKNGQELQAHLAVRTAYWRAHDAPTTQALKDNRSTLIDLDDQSRINLQNSINGVESDRTAFVGSSLLLNQMLQPGTQWTSATGTFAAGYFKRFSGPATEPFRTQLSDKLKVHLTGHFEQLLGNANFARIVSDYEALPISLQSIQKTPTVAWAVAEAYRQTNQHLKAVTHYETAAQGMTTDADRFKANFWLASSASKVLQANRAQRGSSSPIPTQAKLRKADGEMERAWKNLDEAKKTEVYAAMRTHLEKSLEDTTLLRTPATIILDRWSQKLTTETSLASSSTPEAEPMVSASSNSVKLLNRLANRFTALGMNKEKQSTIALMQYLKPASFGDDAAARKLWANQLNGLANEYREANRFLEAGKIYALAGSESADWEDRAESLYKGGLLLFRAGRKQEAIDAFRKAAEDVNNQFYANLAKERLSQLEQ